MLCSVSTGKSGGSSWLERLRSNKGFPTGDTLGLDHFLTNHSNLDPSDSPIATNGANSPTSNSDLTQSDNQRVTSHTEILCEDNKPKEREWFGVMNNVLCELFNMGGPTRSSTFPEKKNSRKQSNPRFCVSTPAFLIEPEEKSSDGVRRVGNAQQATASLNSGSNNELAAKIRGEKNHKHKHGVEAEEEEKGERELLGYSRSEVTVIDTSYDVWKFDKLVYRRKNVWKVRDKKGNSRFIGKKKKKRKGNLLDENIGVERKKAKVSTLDLPPTDVPVHGQNPRGRSEEKSNDILINLSEVPRRRCFRKHRKGVSSSKHLVGVNSKSKRNEANSTIKKSEGISLSKKIGSINTTKLSVANSCGIHTKGTSFVTRPDGS